ncbi:TRAP transporter permease [Dethiosulfatarculus sandiegensis]|uniref:C4-dicarboxylate ABC transporter n=1 Tax=Dethiosulfatarculus sandiegensis TaxID=1429043 RepID=A0A0D2JAE8_9BACT|nr:TRAP transporter permease [Dethiosulfatarculus sandiegensis]KIX15109.1 C4-dicarboxylate ABC transporter [Dethiosulfatarculus sandiegensis]
MQDHDLDSNVLESLAAKDFGGRTPGPYIYRLLIGVAFLWACYQLYIASPLPLKLDFLLFDDNQQRNIHLAFGLFLALLSFPAFVKSPKSRIPKIDWILCIAGVVSCLYVTVFYDDISERLGGTHTVAEIVISVIGLLCLMEATRRIVGLPMVLVASVFALYAFGGRYMPSVIAHAGVSLNRFVDHLWLTPEGIFGLPIGVSNGFIFLYVLFGSLLDRAGAGSFFIRLSMALLGHYRGGAAKAAVVSSGLTGLISGSTIANIVTTGTFTIPLMRKSGFSPEKAGAIEVASSLNGQIMPPIMGAAAFVMAEMLGISYYDVVKHAFVPAVISYMALFYIVHIEALKENIPVAKRVVESTFFKKAFLFATCLILVIVSSVCIYFVISGLKFVFGDYTVWAAILLVSVSYLLLLYLSSRQPDNLLGDEISLEAQKGVKSILLAGAYYVVPVGVLIWCLMVERFSPGFSVQWAILCLLVMLISQRPLVALFRKQSLTPEMFKEGLKDLFHGMVNGSRNMVTVAIAMASAGFIVGVVSLTGVGLLMTDIISTVSGNNVLLMLLFTAVMCVVLGLGLPSTANYIVVASVMAQPFVQLASQNGLSVEPFAIHLFVFYFGLISGTTPPVAVDAFAGAAVAKANPMKTCIISFGYSLRTAILPFIFLFNQELLLFGVSSFWYGLFVFIIAVVAILVFAAASQQYFITKSHLWESAVLLLAAFTLFYPSFWLDQIQEKYAQVPVKNIMEIAEKQPDGQKIRLLFRGRNFSGEDTSRVVLTPLGAAGKPGKQRLSRNAGVVFKVEGEKVIASAVLPGREIAKSGVMSGWELYQMQLPRERIAKQWFYLPAFLVIALIVFFQKRRMPKSQALSEGSSVQSAAA